MRLQEFESWINRSPLRFRSKRLDAVVAAIRSFVSEQTEGKLRTLEAAIQTWKSTDPKEYANRGKPIEPKLADALLELIANRWAPGRFVLVDPDSHPEYKPERWNADLIKLSTNCYAYACDDPYNHAMIYDYPDLSKPQPGLYMKRHQPWVMVREDITEDGVRDGVSKDNIARSHRQLAKLRAVSVPPDKVTNISGFYLIALVIDETPWDPDYHWYRQDRNGYWSHKPGHCPATDLDASGKRILDPRACDLGRYKFSTFYHAPRGGVRTTSEGDMLRPPTPLPEQIRRRSISHSDMENLRIEQSIRRGSVNVAPRSSLMGRSGSISADPVSQSLLRSSSASIAPAPQSLIRNSPSVSNVHLDGNGRPHSRTAAWK